MRALRKPRHREVSDLLQVTQLGEESNPGPLAAGPELASLFHKVSHHRCLSTGVSPQVWNEGRGSSGGREGGAESRPGKAPPQPPPWLQRPDNVAPGSWRESFRGGSLGEAHGAAGPAWSLSKSSQVSQAQGLYTWFCSAQSHWSAQQHRSAPQLHRSAQLHWSASQLHRSLQSYRSAPQRAVNSLSTRRGPRTGGAPPRPGPAYHPFPAIQRPGGHLKATPTQGPDVAGIL